MYSTPVALFEPQTVANMHFSMLDKLFLVSQSPSEYKSPVSRNQSVCFEGLGSDFRDDLAQAWL